MTVLDLNPKERQELVELLEMAHGYSIMGSIIPMRAARLELSMPADSKVFMTATAELKRQFGPSVSKPTAEEYSNALGKLVDRVLKERTDDSVR